MKTAQQNIGALPAYCWSVLPATRELIRIKAGEVGYYPTQLHRPSNLPMITSYELADQLNTDLGVSKAQQIAMEHGSMFGWGTPAADPDNYDKAGNPIDYPNRKTA